MEAPEKSNHELVAAIQQLKDELQQVSLQLEKEVKTRQHAEFLLGERQKELNCQFLISKILSSAKIEAEQALNKILDTIPPAMQFPDITEASISVNGKTYKTKHFADSEFCIEQPVFINEKKVGELKVCYRQDKYNGKKEAFFKEEHELIFNIAVRISRFLAQKEEEKKADESAQLYQSFMQASPDLLIITDLAGVIEFASPSAIKIFNFDKTETLSGRNILDFIDSTEKQKAQKRIEDMFRGDFAGAEEFKGVKADGSPIWVDVSGEFIRNSDGEPVKMIFIIRDISQKRETAENLRKNEEMYRGLVESSEAAIFMVDATGKYLYLNSIEARRYGKTPEEITGKNIHEFLPVQETRPMLDDIKKVFAENKGFTREVEHDFNGVFYNFRISLQPVRDENNQPFAVLFYVNDISELVQTTKKIEKSEERFRMLVENINDAIYEIAADATIKYVSPSIEKVVGYKPEELIGKNFFDYMYPDDKPMLSEALQKFGTLDFSHLEYRYIARNGDVRWVRSSTAPVVTNGILTGGIGSLTDITERKLAEEKLRVSEARFEQIAEQSNTVIWEVDKNGLYTYVNQIAEKVWGYKPDELIGKIHYYDLHPLENRAEFKDATMKFITGKQQFVDLPNPIVRKDGNVIIVSTNGISVVDSNGNLLGYRGADNDITEKLKAGEELRMFKIASDHSTFGKVICKPNGELMYVNKAWAKMLGYKTEELIGQNISVGQNKGQKTELERLLKIMFDEGSLTAQELWFARKDGSIFPALMNATLIKNEKNEIKYFSATTIDISDLKEAQGNVRKSEQKYREIFENIQDIYYENLMDGTIVEISPSVQIVSRGQYTREELIGTSVLDLYANVKEREKLSAEMFKNGMITDYEIELRNKDLSTIPVSISASLIFDENHQPLKVVGSIRDISERKSAEEQLKLSEEKYRSMFKNNKSVIMVIDPITGSIVDANSAAADFYGWSIEEICNKKISEINTLPVEKVKFNLQQAISSKSLYFDFEHRIANGEIKNVETFVGPLNDGDKKYIYAIVHDVTDKKKAEKALLESEKNLKNAQQIANMGSWQFFPKTGEVKWSENYYKILERNPELEPLSLSEIIQMVHPDDSKMFDDKVNEMLVTREITTLYFRLILSDNKQKWIQSNMAPVFDDHGDLIEIQGISIDITDKKESEEALKNQKEQLQAIVKAIPDMMFVIDKNENFLEYYASEKHRLLLPREAIVGNKMKDTFAPDDYSLHISKVNLCLTQQSIVEYEYAVDVPENRLYYDARIVPMPNETVLCFVRDITERKHSEILIKKLSQAVEQSPVMTVITDRNGIIEYTNPAFEEITGYSLSEVIGKNPRILQSGQTPIDTYKSMWTTIVNGKSWSGEWLNRKKDGTFYWEDVTISPISNDKDEIINFVALKQDSTQRKETELKLKNFNRELELQVDLRTTELALKTRELENFFNVSLDLLCIADTSGNFIKVNKAWEDILGYNKKELENHKFLDFIHPDDLQETYNAIGALKNNEKVVKFVNRYCTHDGDYKYIEWHSVPVGETIYAAARDITESKLIADFQSELLNLSSKLAGIPYAEIIPAIELSLMRIGKFLSADRAYIFEFNTDLSLMTNTFEWCNTGITAEIQNLQNIPTHIFPEWKRQLLSHEDIVVPDVNLLPENWSAEREFVQSQDVQSMIIIPLLSENRLIGFAGIDYVKELKNFKESEIRILKLWSAMLAGLINNFRVERLLEQARQNMETFFNTIDDFLFVLDDAGNIIHVNETVKNRLGFDTNDLVGKSVLSVHSPDRQEEAARIVVEMLEGKVDSCQVPIVTKYGEEIQVETRIKKGMWNGKPAIFGVTKDISQIKLSEEKFSTAFHTNVSLMAISNIDDSRYVEVNESFLKVLGYTREEVIGKTSTDLGIFVDAPDDIEMKKHLMKNEPVRDVELRVRTKSGDIRIGLFSIDMINIGNERKYLATMVDITERKKIEKELIHARNEAESANRAKSEFLSRMSHELRTPMNSILGFAQLLEMGDLGDRQKNGVTHILRSGKYLLNMINEVLELARIESGRLSLSIEPVGVNAVVNEILDLIRPQSEQKNISILTNAMSNEMFVNADKQKLKQILLNIINNAIKYNNEGGRIEISVDFVKPADKTGDYVRISVVDNGTGISEENLEKIFSPFERIGAEKTGIEGTGLGLSVSKKLTEAMNGTIGVESTVGSGSRFWVEFPFIQKGECKKEFIEAEKENSYLNAEITGTVLYFEDNESNIELIDQIIFENRPSVKFFAQKDGINAVEFVTKISPDLIFLDLNLPGKQGDEILEEILNTPDLKDIPVVMVSADAMPQQIRNLLKIGARSYMTKPINVSQLLKTIDQYLIK